MGHGGEFCQNMVHWSREGQTSSAFLPWERHEEYGRKEILKIRAEINVKETKETIAKINKAKSWFFERISKTDKLLTRLIKKQREKNQINKIRNENGEITIDNTEIQRIIRLLSAIICQKIDNVEEMDKFLEKYNFPKLNQEEIENLNRPITSTKLKL